MDVQKHTKTRQTSIAWNIFKETAQMFDYSLFVKTRSACKLDLNKNVSYQEKYQRRAPFSGAFSIHPSSLCTRLHLLRFISVIKLFLHVSSSLLWGRGAAASSSSVGSQSGRQSPVRNEVNTWAGPKMKQISGELVKWTHSREVGHFSHHCTVVWDVVDVPVLTRVICYHVQLASMDVRHIHLDERWTTEQSDLLSAQRKGPEKI